MSSKCTKLVMFAVDYAEDTQTHTVLQAWNGPEGSRKSRFPDVGKVVSLTHRPHLPQEIHLVLISVRGCVDSRAIVRPEGLCH